MRYPEPRALKPKPLIIDLRVACSPSSSPLLVTVYYSTVGGGRRERKAKRSANFLRRCLRAEDTRPRDAPVNYRRYRVSFVASLMFSLPLFLSFANSLFVERSRRPIACVRGAEKRRRASVPRETGRMRERGGRGAHAVADESPDELA